MRRLNPPSAYKKCGPMLCILTRLATAQAAGGCRANKVRINQ
jgi:hypothetical protein